MSKTFTYKTPYGDTKVILQKRRYNNGTLAIQMLSYEEHEGWGPYAVITKNIDPYTGDNLQSDTRAFLDTNNCKGIEAFVVENDLATPLGISARSGYCTYPLYEFNLEKF